MTWNAKKELEYSFIESYCEDCGIVVEQHYARQILELVEAAEQHINYRNPENMFAMFQSYDRLVKAVHAVCGTPPEETMLQSYMPKLIVTGDLS